MSLGIVTEHLISLIAKQVNDNGLVVWYHPDGAYAATPPVLNLADSLPTSTRAPRPARSSPTTRSVRSPWNAATSTANGTTASRHGPGRPGDMFSLFCISS